MTSDTNAKKDIQKLQRAIVDGLEDVKGQDIVVFNTETLSPLFERVIIASGTSNRQTKALASSVRDAVREAGFDKPRIEGEDNGEWIIVDCGQAVAHVMQPVIRQYYRLEEIWGQKPVRLKHGAEKPAAAPAKKAAAKKKSTDTVVAPISGKTVVRKTAKSTAAPASAASNARTMSPKGTAKSPSKSPVHTPAGKTVAKSAKPKAALPKLIVNKPKPAAKSSARPAVAKAAPAKKAAAKKKA
jgi:ribosome-associated protein